jgi:hypothetical protein
VEEDEAAAKATLVQQFELGTDIGRQGAFTAAD